MGEQTSVPEEATMSESKDDLVVSGCDSCPLASMTHSEGAKPAAWMLYEALLDICVQIRGRE